jgi:fructosamine-3-kinase
MVVTDSQVKDIFKALNLNVNKISKINTFANFLLKVKTDRGNYFLKIYTAKHEVKTGYKLANLYPFLLKQNLPVPEVLKFDDSLKLIEHPYLIISEIKGEMLSDGICKLNRTELLEFYFDFGETVAKIHLISFDKFGETFDGVEVKSASEIGGKGPFGTWIEMHKEIVSHRLSYFKGTFFENLIVPIKSWFEENYSLLDYNVVPRLLHIDLNQKNTFLDNNKISGIIDFDGSFIGHNEEELMRTEGAHFSTDEELRASFFKGYTKLIKLDENYEKRRIFYYLSRLLVHIDCLVLYGENYVNDIEKEQEIVKDEILKILDGTAVVFGKNQPNT